VYCKSKSAYLVYTALSSAQQSKRYAHFEFKNLINIKKPPEYFRWNILNRNLTYFDQNIDHVLASALPTSQTKRPRLNDTL
jgi:hypothetical protein